MLAIVLGPGRIALTLGQDFRNSAWLKRERRLLKKAKRGDRRAMEELYRAFAPVLYKQVLLPRCLDESAAEDVLSDTFVTAFSKLDSFEHRGLSMFFWLARIANNKATDLYRKNAKAKKGLDEMERLLKPLMVAHAEQTQEMVQLLDSEGLQYRINMVLKKIRPRYAQALRLRFLQGMDRAECASVMDVKIGTFDVLLLRALKAFGKEWSHEP